MAIVLKKARYYTNGTFLKRNILLEDGKIARISEDRLKAETTIDCEGKFVLPGLIDAHVHFRVPGEEHKEDWKTGSSAAASGGVTTVLDMPNNNPPASTVKVLEQKRKIAAKHSLVNFGFHFGATGDNLDEIKKASNIASLKVYMASTTGNLLITDQEKLKAAFQAAKENNLVAMVHAEDEEMIQKNMKSAREKGWNSVEFHASIRSDKAEKKAMEKALALQKEVGNKLYFCHLASKEAVQLLEVGKNENVFCEVTPHNLFLLKDEVKALKNLVKVNSPIRGKLDQNALWQAINLGLIDVIATDHAPHTLEEKQKDYWEAPSGIPGVETLLPLLLNAANENRFSLRQVAEFCAEHPAQIFGLKNKGFVKEGFDADLVVVDLQKESEIKNENLFTKCKWSPFNGMKIRGLVEKTFVNGNLVFEDGKIVGKAKGKEAEFSR